MAIYLDLIFRWIHILAAIALVGGTVFMRFALAPAMASLGEDIRLSLQEAVRSRWSKAVMAGAGLLLISGLYTTARMAITYQLTPLYNGLLLVKIVLALVIFYIASALHGRSGTAQRMRQNLMMWLNVNLVLAVVLVLIAGLMRWLPHDPKVRDEVRAKATVAAGPDSKSPARIALR